MNRNLFKMLTVSGLLDFAAPGSRPILSWPKLRYHSQAGLARIVMMFIAAIIAFQSTASTHTTTIDGVVYEFNYDPYNISNCCVTVVDGSRASGEVFIESTYEYDRRFYSVRKIKASAFENNTKITSVYIPPSIGEIGENAFNKCKNLKSVDIGWNPDAESLSVIDKYVFAETALEYIRIPPSVTYIDNTAFDECYQLTAINVDFDNPNYSSYEGVLYSKDQTYMEKCPQGRKTLSVSPKCQDINFSNCKYLESVVLPESVTEIGSMDFGNCESLRSVELTESVIGIATDAFFVCKSLEGIVIPKSVKVLEGFAFYGCINLRSVEYLAENPIEGEGYNIFPSEVYSQATLTVAPEAIDKIKTIYPWKYFVNIEVKDAPIDVGLVFEVDGIRYKILSVEDNTVAVTTSDSNDDFVVDANYMGDISLPESVAYGGKTFKITEIEEWAFDSCKELTNIELPSSLLKIGDYAFYGCASLEIVRIPGSVEKIGSAPFCDCTNLEFINVQKSNKHYVAENGILYDKEMTELIQCPGGKSDAVTVPSTVIKIGDSSFEGCLLLTSVELPESLTIIGQNAFLDCRRLTSIVIPDKVTSIGHSSFRGCTDLTSVTIGLSVKDIGDLGYASGAFFGSNHIKKIICKSETPIVNANLECPDNVYADAVLYVPEKSLSSYKNTNPWSKFKKIEAVETLGLENVESDPESSIEKIFDLNGVRILRPSDTLLPGVYIIQHGSKTEKRVIN